MGVKRKEQHSVLDQTNELMYSMMVPTVVRKLVQPSSFRLQRLSPFDTTGFQTLTPSLVSLPAVFLPTTADYVRLSFAGDFDVVDDEMNVAKKNMYDLITQSIDARRDKSKALFVAVLEPPQDVGRRLLFECDFHVSETRAPSFLNRYAINGLGKLTHADANSLKSRMSTVDAISAGYLNGTYQKKQCLLTSAAEHLFRLDRAVRTDPSSVDTEIGRFAIHPIRFMYSALAATNVVGFAITAPFWFRFEDDFRPINPIQCGEPSPFTNVTEKGQTITTTTLESGVTTAPDVPKQTRPVDVPSVVAYVNENTRRSKAYSAPELLASSRTDRSSGFDAPFESPRLSEGQEPSVGSLFYSTNERRWYAFNYRWTPMFFALPDGITTLAAYNTKSVSVLHFRATQARYVDSMDKITWLETPNCVYASYRDKAVYVTSARSGNNQLYKYFDLPVLPTSRIDIPVETVVDVDRLFDPPDSVPDALIEPGAIYIKHSTHEEGEFSVMYVWGPYPTWNPFTNPESTISVKGQSNLTLDKQNGLVGWELNTLAFVKQRLPAGRIALFGIQNTWLRQAFHALSQSYSHAYYIDKASESLSPTPTVDHDEYPLYMIPSVRHSRDIETFRKYDNPPIVWIQSKKRLAFHPVEADQGWSSALGLKTLQYTAFVDLQDKLNNGFVSQNVQNVRVDQINSVCMYNSNMSRLEEEHFTKAPFGTVFIDVKLEGAPSLPGLDESSRPCYMSIVLNVSVPSRVGTFGNRVYSTIAATNPDVGDVKIGDYALRQYDGTKWNTLIEMTGSDQSFSTLTITDPTNSTSSTTGALKITGGVGVGKDVNVAGAMLAATLEASDSLKVGSDVEIGGDVSVAGVVRAASIETSSPNMTPVGSIVWWPLSTPPRGFLVCDGSAISFSDYRALCTLLGDTFGPVVNNLYRLPNLIGRFVRGESNASRIGNQGGVEKITLSEANIPSHSHRLNGVTAYGESDPPANTLITKKVNYLSKGGNYTPLTDVITSTGMGAAFDITPPFLSLVPIIRAIP